MFSIGKFIDATIPPLLLSVSANYHEKKKNRVKFLLALVVWNALTTQDIFILLCSGCSRANTADLYQISLESLALTVYGQYPEGIF